MNSNTRTGILALQGCITPHQQILQKLGTSARLVKTAADLAEVDRLIMPGGESTTMLTLLKTQGLWDCLAEFGKAKPVWGICAGAILIAKKISHPSQKSFGFIDLLATRNFYGSQLDSFKAEIEIPILSITTRVDFIRAPKLEPMSQEVEVLAYHQSQPVLFKQGKTLASSFHIELAGDPRLHHYFLQMS